MTPEQFWAAMALFHATVVATAWRAAAKSRDRARCQLPTGSWLRSLARDLALFAVLTYVASLVAPVVTNLDDVARLRLGAISGRLMGQAIFGEAILLGLGLAFWHRQAARPGRASILGVGAAALFAIYVDAYHLEPRMLQVREHLVEWSSGDSEARNIRILQVTDIQSPIIGPHEERALLAGLAQRPDLIVLTGDYVQNELGRSTQEEAAQDLQALIARIGFQAPLGVFGTDGDVGPSCREVFAETNVRCLVDETAIVHPFGSTVAITGLSLAHGRERDPARLAWVMGRAPKADYRIVISHAPDFVDAMPERVDLVLAGHTHGGQVVLPLFGPLWTASRLPRLYAGDLHDYRGIPLHVSRGVGMERGFAPPVRFLCPPEICVLDVRLTVAPQMR